MSEVLSTTAEMQAELERTGQLAPMYARELFTRIAELEDALHSRIEMQARTDAKLVEVMKSEDEYRAAAAHWRAKAETLLAELDG